ncbi:MAG TPA: FAD-dependent oxidoreductase [Hypericibacter adhaerens]|uniref:dihydrolipoyl dehydrogenase family protein n=1 Tax=Hypericibacter adhaerens TaxID=2602016 RepID=UPI002BFE642D|nr:FAD-dependent oxidoreductase [Hypericibacter adhaerens]HWA41793.1 FAD-dependent oxidoreductase [Hypericibacter adhaerens]
MPEPLRADLCVIGAGSGGLNVAAAGAQLGLSTVLIEGGEMGGDCLNSGCVPSKALIAAARVATQHRLSAAFGVDYAPPRIDFARVRAHVKEAIAAIEPHDSQARYEGLGVRVVRAMARFTGPDRLIAGEQEIAARRFCIATGANPAIPDIVGLDQVPFRTLNDIFDLETLPSHLLIIGGGSGGCELGQAFRRLGARVTILEMKRLLGDADPELVEVVRRRLCAEGVVLREGAQAISVSRQGANLRLTLQEDSKRDTIEGSHLLLAAGRVPASDGLGLEAAGIARQGKAITIDGRCRTSNRRVWAIGDVTGGPQFTHWASHQALVVIKSMMLRLPARTRPLILPRVTFTDPELAQVGMTEVEARAAGHDRLVVRRWPFAENDRAETDRTTAGFVKLVATPKGRILGAGIAGVSAGELIQSWSLALAAGLSLRAFTEMITVYPTLGDASKRAASGFYAERLLNDRTRRWVRWMARWS